MILGSLQNFLRLQLSKPRWVRRTFGLHPEGIGYVRHEGNPFFLYLGDFYGPSYHLMHWGVASYEAQNQKYIKRVLSFSNRSVFLDVGANIGIFSVLAAMEGSKIQVYAFDPDEKSRECLNASVKANHLHNVEILSDALSQDEGNGILFLDGKNHGGNSLNEHSIEKGNGEPGLKRVSVRLTTLDKFAERKALQRIDLIKIDVQEHEYEVLLGGKECISKFRPVVLAECSNVNIGDKKDLFNFFEDLDYQVFDPNTETVFSLSEARDALRRKGLEHAYSDFFFFPKEKSFYFSDPERADRKKHLVFLTEHLSFGGTERSLIEYLNCIDEKRFRVSLILRDERADNYLLASVPEHVQIKTIYREHEIPKETFSFKKLFLAKIDLTVRLKKSLRELGPCDLVLDFASVLIKQAHYFSDYRKMYWIHGPKSHMGFLELRKFSIRLRSYDLIATVSEHLKTELASLLPHLEGKIVRLYNPIDIVRIHESSTDKSELSAEELTLLHQPYICAVGRFAVEKDFSTLIQAYGVLRRRGFDVKLYIIGDGPLRPQIEHHIRMEKLEGQVILLGAKRNPYVWMKNAQMFVHSAFFEGFGLVILEAMVLGRAVVVTDSPVGPREILQDGVFGKLVPVGNVELLAQSVAQVLDNPDLKDEQQELALGRAQDFSSQVILPDFYKALDSFNLR